jgi:hypothetical protein
MTYEDRMKMDALSLKALGGKSKWNKLYTRGYPAKLTRTKEDGEEETYNGIKYQTLEEVYNVMVEMLAKKEAEEAAKKAKELETKVEVKDETKGQD